MTAMTTNATNMTDRTDRTDPTYPARLSGGVMPLRGGRFAPRKARWSEHRYSLCRGARTAGGNSTDKDRGARTAGGNMTDKTNKTYRTYTTDTICPPDSELKLR